LEDPAILKFNFKIAGSGVIPCIKIRCSLVVIKNLKIKEKLYYRQKTLLLRLRIIDEQKTILFLINGIRCISEIR
jgi:hypothetical protein